MNQWISGVTSLASALSEWISAKKTGLNSELAGSRALSARSVGGNQAQFTNLINVVIRDELLRAYVVDIHKAERRFIDSISNSRCSSDDRDYEARVARKSVRVHLLKVLEHNGGDFPSAELQRFWTSCMCDAWE